MKNFWKRFGKIFVGKYKPERLRRDLEIREWVNDYGQGNLSLHAEAASFFGIKRKIYVWHDLGYALHLRSSWGAQPAVQDALLLKIEEDLGVKHLHKKDHQNSSSPNIKGIVEKLKLEILRPIEKLPIPFIIYAFIDYRKRQF